MTIICPKHGEFLMRPYNHLAGKGCKQCFYERATCTTAEFIKKANDKHNCLYDYSKVNYVNSSTKITIICPIHGEFYQTPAAHLQGACCPKCKMSRLEHEIMIFLQQHNIEYVYEYNPKWLNRLRLDFYLPQYKIAIECQGEQHFKKTKYYNDDKSHNFEQRRNRDIKKFKLCKENNIDVIYYTHYKSNSLDFFAPLIYNQEELLTKIYHHNGQQ